MLADGSRVCWLNMVDEMSSASIGMPVFEYGRIGSVPLEAVKSSLEDAFTRWGAPELIKVDNGLPFGSAGGDCVPWLSLWLVGHGIGVVWNRPASPRLNAKVERKQGVFNKWSAPQTAADAKGLAGRLVPLVKFYNEAFRMRGKGWRSAGECHPEIYENGRKWNQSGFDIRRVLDYLSGYEWERLASGKGQIFIYDQRFSIGSQHKGENVRIRLDASENRWVVKTVDGDEIGRYKTDLTVEKINPSRSADDRHSDVKRE